MKNELRKAKDLSDFDLSLCFAYQGIKDNIDYQKEMPWVYTEINEGLSQSLGIIELFMKTKPNEIDWEDIKKEMVEKYNK
jgi:hypothetical protein